MSKLLHCDCGLYNTQLYGQYGQGFAKINLTPNKRLELSLETKDNTNQEAEIFAVLSAITFAIKHKVNTIYSDSQFVVKSVNDNWKVKEPRLKLSIAIIKSLLSYWKIKLQWIRREDNWAT